jgi:chemosensory pili system protein ChpA (sensor histidine kinase/response regulator)
MDRGMLGPHDPCLEHLLRNVPPTVSKVRKRAAAGKDPAGLITVHLKHEGNDVSVDLCDDGQGLDLTVTEKVCGSDPARSGPE